MEKIELINTMLDEVEFRTDMVLKNKNEVALRISDLTTEMGFTENTFKIAILRGSSGKYGVSYKLNTQVICSWLYSYKNDNKGQL